MTTGYERVYEALDSQGLIQPSWSDGVSAHCPGPIHHRGDASASLSLNEGEDGRALVYCHGGDSIEDVLGALGLTIADAFSDEEAPAGGVITAQYIYEDEDGNPLIRVSRIEPGPNGKRKSFTQESRKGDGWEFGLNGTRKVLYNLPRVLDAVKSGSPVYAVEGELCADALSTLGVCATTSLGGAGKNKWKDEYSEILRGADVVVIPDLDEVGREHAERIVESLRGMARSVAVKLPAVGNDIADHIAAGLTLQDLKDVDLVDELGGLDWDEYAVTEAHWLYEPYIPVAGRVLLAGKKGSLKSLWSMWIACKLAESGKRVAYFCMPPDQRVLTAELKWKPLGDVVKGEELVGFDETLAPYKGNLAPSTVTDLERIMQPVYRIVTDQGEVTASEGHMFVESAETKTGSFARRWVYTKDIHEGMRLSFFEKPWANDVDPEDKGYLAAAFDGEGCAGNKSLTFYQNDNPMLAKVLALLSKHGFEHSVKPRVRDRGFNVRLSSRSALRFMGVVEPVRLLPRARELWEGRRYFTKARPPANVISVEYLGEQEVVAIGTSTHTFISEGFLSHNSVEMRPSQSVARIKKLNPPKGNFSLFTKLELEDSRHQSLLMDSLVGYDLIVFDSWNAIIRNARYDQDIADLDNDVFQPLIDATGATLLFIDNVGHDAVTSQGIVKMKRARGSSAKGDKVDVELFMERPIEQDNYTCELSMTKMRYDHPMASPQRLSTPQDDINFYLTSEKGLRMGPAWTEPVPSEKDVAGDNSGDSRALAVTPAAIVEEGGAEPELGDGQDGLLRRGEKAPGLAPIKGDGRTAAPSSAQPELTLAEQLAMARLKDALGAKEVDGA